MIANMIAFGVQFGVSFILTPHIIQTLGGEAYGFVPLANNIIGYVNIVTVALNSMSSRFITLELTRKNERQANVYFNSVLTANTILAALLSLPSILFVLNINYVINVPNYLLHDVQLTFAFALLGMEIALITSVYGDTFFIKNRLDLSAKRNIEGNLIRAVVLIILFVLLKPKINFVTGSMLIVTLYICSSNYYYTRKLTPELRLGKQYFQWKAVKTLLSSGVWNSINQLSTVLLTTLDLLLANVFVNALASGQYAIVKTVPNFIQSIVAVLVSVFVPQFMLYYAENKKIELLDSILFSVQVMAYILMIPIGFLIVFGEDFFHVWVPSQNALFLQELSLMTIIPMIVTCSVNTLFNVYTVTNKLRIPALILLGTSLITTVLVICLLRMSSIGIIAIPLVAMVVGVFRNLTFTPIYAARCLGLKWNFFYKSIGRGALCSLTMIAICFVYRFCFGGATTWIGLILAAISCCFVALIVNLYIAFGKAERTKLLSTLRARLRLS